MTLNVKTPTWETPRFELRYYQGPVDGACAGLTESLVAVARVAKVFFASSDLRRHRIE